MRARKISLWNRAGHVDDGNFDSIDSKVSIRRLTYDSYFLTASLQSV